MTDIPLQAELCTGFAAGTRVMTVEGAVAVEALKPGERIVTRQGVCRLIAAQARDWADPAAITVRASALGHGRPEADLTLAAEQPLMVRDWRAGQLYGAAQAAVPARRLLDGTHVIPARTGPLRLVDLVFETAQIIYAEGIEVQTVILAKEPGAV